LAASLPGSLEDELPNLCWSHDGESDWKDAYGATVVGHGTDEVAVDDRVTIFMARDTDAALARGISQHQLIEQRAHAGPEQPQP